MRPLVLLLACSAIALIGQPGSGAHAQTPPASGQLSERIEVRVSSVDFVALDAKGEVVSGLDPRSISVVENGSAREVTSFTEVKRGPGKSTATAQQHVAIFFDDNSLTSGTRKKIIDAAVGLVKKAVERGDLVEIVTARSETRVRQAWTGDLALLRAALDTVGKEVPGGERLEAERRRVQSQIGTMIQDNSDGDAIPMDFNMIVAGVRHYAEQRAAEFDVTASGLGKYIETLEPLPGKKAVLIATESFPVLPGSDMYQYLANVQQIIVSTPSSPYRSAAGKGSALSEMGRFQKTQLLTLIAQAANQSGVAVYGVNPKGPGSGKAGNVETFEHTGSLSEDFATGMGGIDGLQMLANATGGTALVGKRPQKAFEQLDAQLGNYYSIAYRSDLAAGAARSLEIKTTAKGVNLRYPRASIGIDVPTRQTGNDLLLDPPANELGISVVRGQVSSPSPDQRIVAMQIMIPVDKLKLEQNAAGMFEGGFTILIQFRDKAGTEISSVDNTQQSLSWTASQLADAKGQSITFLANVTVRGKRDQLTVRVVDQKSQTMGQTSIDLSTP